MIQQIPSSPTMEKRLSPLALRPNIQEKDVRWLETSTHAKSQLCGQEGPVVEAGGSF